jgi:hypothetical protein
MQSLIDELDNADPFYFIPRDDVVNRVLNPAFTVSSSVDCMMGYFTSHSLSEIAPGLAVFLSRTTAPLRLVVSPFISTIDHEAIQFGYRSAEEISEQLFEEGLPSANALAHHTLSCF